MKPAHCRVFTKPRLSTSTMAEKTLGKQMALDFLEAPAPTRKDRGYRVCKDAWIELQWVYLDRRFDHLIFLSQPHACFYQAVSCRHVRELIREANKTKETFENFIDIGSGKRKRHASMLNHAVFQKNNWR